MTAQRGTLVVIGGPTASGKSALAASVARALGTAVISADARQFYRAMPIGTAQPDEAERQGVQHHFVGHLDVADTWSAGTFARAAEPVLQDLVRRQGTAVMAGGSGLYIDAVLHGLDPLPSGRDDLRRGLQERLRTEGLAALLEELRSRDPEHWAAMDRNNPHRVLRALEVCIATGAPYSAQRTSPAERTDLRILRFAIDMPRPELYTRIDARVDRMMACGLPEEARALLPARHLNALNTVGYKELFAHFDGLSTLEQAVALIKQHTRNYAKRQLTWLRRDPRWRPVQPGSGAAEAVLTAARAGTIP